MRQNADCQNAHWKAHKPQCAVPGIKMTVADGPLHYHMIFVPSIVLPPFRSPSAISPVSAAVGLPLRVILMPSGITDNEIVVERDLEDDGEIRTITVSPWSRQLPLY